MCIYIIYEDLYLMPIYLLIDLQLSVFFENTPTFMSICELPSLAFFSDDLWGIKSGSKLYASVLLVSSQPVGMWTQVFFKDLFSFLCYIYLFHKSKKSYCPCHWSDVMLPPTCLTIVMVLEIFHITLFTS